ncbi:uncharacterized protein LOC126662361 isoform X2 [Mercurialis annua]|uniref:uncharacterized protein LOC126662361 isoform X2 n=1 Tax=Mercurialis annua TaxID=3986 RepID=UPI00215E735F|nr:uncharacterized protein LOC126662361 isoform X2 [Mercurialis annua]
MPVSGNQENAVRTLGGQSSLNISGVPVKKRRFIWPSSPTPEEQQREQSLVSISQESELAATNSCDASRDFATEDENKRCSENCNGPRSRIEELTPSHKSDSLAKLDDDGKLLTAENSAKFLTGVKPLGGVPMKKRRFIRASSSLLEDQSSLNEDKRSCDSRVKIEETCCSFQSDAKMESLVAKEKSANIPVRPADTQPKLAPNKASPFHVNKEIFSPQVDKLKGISTISGDPVSLLGLEECYRAALENRNDDGSSWNQGNIEPVSLNLSLSSSEKSFQCKMVDTLSNTESSKTHTDRANWDLNTTMDAWEASVSEEAASQVTSDGSKAVSVADERKPMIALGILEESDSRTSFMRVSLQSDSDERLHLGLSPSFLSVNNQELSSSSTNKDSHFAVPNSSLTRQLLSGSRNSSSRSIKSEPLDESQIHDSTDAKVNPMVMLDFRALPVKRELVEALNSPNSSVGKSLGAKSMKSEPLHEDNGETLKSTDGTSHQSSKQVLRHQKDKGQSTCSPKELITQSQDTGGQPNCSTDEHVLLGTNSVTEPTSLVGSSLNDHLSDHLEHEVDGGAYLSSEAIKESSDSAEQVAAELVFPVCHNGDENNGSGTGAAGTTEKKSVDNSNEMKFKDSDAHRNGEGTVSDEERINLSADILEGDSYSSDYESDGKSVPMDIEEDGRGQDELEDGEVREPQLNVELEVPICDINKIASQGDSDDNKANSAELHDDVHPSSYHVEGKKYSTEKPVETNKPTVEDVDTALGRQTSDIADKDSFREETLAVDVMADAGDKRNIINTIRRRSLDLVTNKDETAGTEKSSDQAMCEDLGILVAATQGTYENNDEKDESALLKMETNKNGDDAPKDANSGGNQSRIINLPVASNMSSFCKTRSLSGKPFPLRPGRERLDVPLEGDRLNPRGRVETYDEGSHKFSREKYQDSRNSRWNFVNGRGRLGSRVDNLRNDRDSERDCISRHKFASAVAGSDTEFMNYNIGSDSGFGCNVRGGRKLVDDDTSNFHHRRRSPGGRDGHASRGPQMVRRVSRSTAEDSSDVVGLRRADKIMRGFDDDGEEPAYTRPQPPYEGLDGRFVQGTRNFSSLQRRGPQMHSKSPIRSRSPGPWSSRRRSPDGFCGPPDMPHRRSPIYRMERIRSPDNPGFPAERVSRRHGSPTFMARPNDLREMDPGRDHGHVRSIMSSRSPTGRGGLVRGSRRFGVLDPRERPDNEEFFAGPVHSGRFHELGGDGNEERRRFGDRRAPVRSFRPPFNGTDGDNFLNTEDGSRSFRFYPDVDADFHERSNLRDREFDRRIKNRSGNVPRRPRSIEEQEGNYRHGGQVLYDDGFDDVSRVKRKRF